MSVKHLACLGGEPAFADPLPVGQLYFPDWERYEVAMRGIFERQYYTNHGPLARQLEARLEVFLGVKHVVCVTNATIGLMMAAEALELSGKVLTPAMTFLATPLSVARCGLEPVFCDVDPVTHHMTPATLEAALEPGVSAVLGVHLWGSAADTIEVQKWAEKNALKCYWDSAQSMGCETAKGLIGGFGELEVFSLHATKIISAGEGGCVATNDPDIAARLRNIRSSYGAGPAVSVVKTSNGRMSEFQAAIALLSLDDFEMNKANNIALREVYMSELCDIEGITLEPLHGVIASNAQSIVVRVGEDFGVSRNLLKDALSAENVLARRYFWPGVHKVEQFMRQPQWNLPQTDQLNEDVLALPIGSRVKGEDVGTIAKLIREIQRNGAQIG